MEKFTPVVGLGQLMVSGISLVGILAASLLGPVTAVKAQSQGSDFTPPLTRLAATSENYREVINKTVAMVSDLQARQLAQKFGLDILNLTWEDTGRYKGSSVGPNISDMTIQVQQQDPQTDQYELSVMPVIRYPNFSDKSADLRLDQFFLLVGNEKGQRLQRVSLQDILGNLRRYLSKPDSWKGNRNLCSRSETAMCW